MSIKRILSIIAVVAATFTSFGAQAGTVRDAHGNVGYDTAAECDAAVQNGTAKFYQPFTHKKPLLRKGEKSVQQATIRDLGPQYAMGACDVGVGRQSGRDGVSSALVGKYIPFSPDMPVNVYLNSKGEAVRTTMAQCDNWFSGNAPRPVEFVNNAAATPVVEPSAEAVSPELISEPAVTATASPAWLLTPYVFGTIGMHSEHLHSNGNQPSFYNRGVYDDTDRTVAGQVGAGVQFNKYVGGEVFFQGGKSKEYTDNSGQYTQKINHRAIGTRVTVGTDATKKQRVFFKGGVAAVHQDDFHPQWTVGVGGTYNITDKTAIRADYDHYIKRSDNTYYGNMGYSKSNYFGIGLQHKFK